MKIKITRNTVAGGIPVNVGDVVEVPEQEAKFLVQIGKAEKFVEAKSVQAAPKTEADSIETADLKPEMETAAKPRAKRKE